MMNWDWDYKDFLNGDSQKSLLLIFYNVHTYPVFIGITPRNSERVRNSNGHGSRPRNSGRIRNSNGRSFLS